MKRFCLAVVFSLIVYTGTGFAQAAAAKMVGTWKLTSKKAGKVLNVIHAVYTKDGKSRSETRTGTDSQGRTINDVTEWTKQ